MVRKSVDGPPVTRRVVRFGSGTGECVAWWYPPADARVPQQCVVMGPGGGVTRGPGTDRFAARFAAAGYGVLAFDFRGLGDSTGGPRYVLDPRRQQQDWRSALSFAAALPGVDPARIAAWGFSLSAGHLFALTSSGSPRPAAVIAQTPFADGLRASSVALRYETPAVVLRMPLIAAADAIGSRFGRSTRTVPLAGPRGTVAMLSTPDALDGARALEADSYPEWDQVVAARSVLRLMRYRPGRHVRPGGPPMLVVVASDDRSVTAEPARRVAARAGAELLEVAGGHYAPFLDAHETVVAAELDFLRRTIGGDRETTTGAAEQPSSAAAARLIG